MSQSLALNVGKRYTRLNNSMTTRGRQKGMKIGTQLPTRYDGGISAVNFYYAVLARAEADEGERYGYNGEKSDNCLDKMWADYKETEFYKRAETRRGKGLCVNVDTETIEAVAWWVSDYIGT